MTVMNPDLLPKIRSRALLDACQHMPCTLRIASFVGQRCAPQDTVVGCHLPTIGKGVSTKVSDLFVAAGCATCHSIVDHRGTNAMREVIERNYPAAFADRLMRANHETLSRWVGMGLIQVEGGEII
jgi:hypothetical protein